MRTLNRPMFNMGGPIKEGVMHGIREPYRRGTRAALVGNPVYPQTGGRAHHADYFKNIYGAAAPIARSFLNPFKKAKKYIQAGKKLAGQLDTSKWLGTLHPSRRLPPTSGITGTGAGTAWTAGPTKYLSKLKGLPPIAKKLWDQHRYKTIAGGIGLTSDPALEAYKKIPGALKWGAETLLPGWAERAIGIGDKVEEKITDKDGVGTIQENITWTPGGLDPTPIITESMKKKLVTAERDRKLNKMLDIMGYDKSKSTAVHRALVDASQILTQTPGGEQLDITKDIISPIIAATGKRLEKPADIREAAGLLMAKGEIEKDIFQSKGGALDQQVDTLMKNLNMDKATATRVAKGMPKDLREQITVDAAALKTATTHKSFINSAKKWYPNAVVWFNEKEAKDNIPSDQKSEDYLETVMTDKLTKDPTAKVAGTYIINKELIQIDGAGKAKTLFP